MWGRLPDRGSWCYPNRPRRPVRSCIQTSRCLSISFVPCIIPIGHQQSLLLPQSLERLFTFTRRLLPAVSDCSRWRSAVTSCLRTCPHRNNQPTDPCAGAAARRGGGLTSQTAPQTAFSLIPDRSSVMPPCSRPRTSVQSIPSSCYSPVQPSGPSSAQPSSQLVPQPSSAPSSCFSPVQPSGPSSAQSSSQLVPQPSSAPSSCFSPVQPSGPSSAQSSSQLVPQPSSAPSSCFSPVQPSGPSSAQSSSQLPPQPSPAPSSRLSPVQLPAPASAQSLPARV